MGVWDRFKDLFKKTAGNGAVSDACKYRFAAERAGFAIIPASALSQNTQDVIGGALRKINDRKESFQGSLLGESGFSNVVDPFDLKTEDQSKAALHVEAAGSRAREVFGAAGFLPWYANVVGVINEGSAPVFGLAIEDFSENAPEPFYLVYCQEAMESNPVTKLDTVCIGALENEARKKKAHEEKKKIHDDLRNPMKPLAQAIADNMGYSLPGKWVVIGKNDLFGAQQAIRGALKATRDMDDNDPHAVVRRDNALTEDGMGVTTFFEIGHLATQDRTLETDRTAPGIRPDTKALRDAIVGPFNNYTALSVYDSYVRPFTFECEEKEARTECHGYVVLDPVFGSFNLVLPLENVRMLYEPETGEYTRQDSTKDKILMLLRGIDEAFDLAREHQAMTLVVDSFFPK